MHIRLGTFSKTYELVVEVFYGIDTAHEAMFTLNLHSTEVKTLPFQKHCVSHTNV